MRYIIHNGENFKNLLNELKDNNGARFQNLIAVFHFYYSTAVKEEVIAQFFFHFGIRVQSRYFA